jgi:hypothetical protein
MFLQSGGYNSPKQLMVRIIKFETTPSVVHKFYTVRSNI